MVISHLPQLMVKSTPFEQSTITSVSDSFLQPPLPQRRNSQCNRHNSLKHIPKDLNMIIESDDYSDDTNQATPTGEDDSLIMEEHEHEVIE